MNHSELDREEFVEIKTALFGDGKVFDALSIDKESIPSVQQFQWIITRVHYNQVIDLPVSEYIVSPQFVYDITTGPKCFLVMFHFRFYARYTVEDPQCAIFLEIDKIPDEVKRLRIGIDMKCDKKRPFRQLLRTHISSGQQRVTGFVTFHHRELELNQKMNWMFAVKMWNAEVVEEAENDEYLRDLYHIFE